MKVRTIPRAPRAAKRALAAGLPNDGVEEMTDAEVEEITTEEIAADAIVAALIADRIDTDDFDCPELEDLGDDLETAIGTARDYYDALGEAEADLQAEIERLRSWSVHSSKRHCGTFAPLVPSCSCRRRPELAARRGGRHPREGVRSSAARACSQAIMIGTFFGTGEVFADGAYFRSAGAARAER